MKASAVTYEAEEVDEETRMVSQAREGLCREVNERLVLATLHVLSASHHVCHLRRKYKRCPFALHAELGLEIAQDVSEVDVEQVAVLTNHDVAIVSVPDAKNVCCHAITRTGTCEIVLCIDDECKQILTPITST